MDVNVSPWASPLVAVFVPRLTVTATRDALVAPPEEYGIGFDAAALAAVIAESLCY